MAKAGVSQEDLKIRAASQTDERTKAVCASIKHAEKAQDFVIDLIDEVYDYCFPNRPSAYSGRGEDAPGERRSHVIFDETAVNGAPRAASRIQIGTFPQQGRAFELVPGPEYEGDDAELQLATELTHESIRDSNFSGEYHEALQDLLVGTMNMVQLPGRFAGDMEFRSVAPHQCLLEPGPWNYPRAWWMYWKRSHRDIQTMAPKKASFPNDFKKALRDSPDAETVLYDGVMIDTSDRFKDAWKRVWYLKEYDAIIHEEKLEGMGANPWLTTRWNVLSNEMWGRGPLMQLMPAIRTLNLTYQLLIEKAEMDIVGMHTYDDDGVFNPQNVVLQPGLFVPKAPGSDISPLAPSGRFDLTQLVIPDMREAIRKGLFIDEYERDAKTPLSATEISQRLADTSRDLGSVGGRIKTEFADPLIIRSVRLMKEASYFNIPKIDGRQVRIVATSPILRAQDQADIADMVEGYQVMAMMLGEMAAQARFNGDRTSQYIVDKKGIPEKILNTPREIQENAEAAAQVAQQTGALGDLANQSLKGAIGAGGR